MSNRAPCPDTHPRWNGTITCGCAEWYIRGEVVRRRVSSVHVPEQQRTALVTLTVEQLADIVERALAGTEPPWIDLPASELA